jgi:hypothetical protein
MSKVLYLLFLVVFFATLSANLWAIDKTGLVLYFSLDQVQGKDVKDESGNGNDGKIVGDAKIVKDGKFGSALENTKGCIEVQDSKTLDGMDKLTIEIWIKLDTDHQNVIIGKGPAWGNESYMLQSWSDGQMYFGILDTSSRAISKAGPLKEWYHTAASFDGNTLKLYINGKEVSSANSPSKIVPDTATSLFIGGLDAAVGYPFIGSIDEVAIWNRTLSQAEIEESMRGKILTAAVESAGKLTTAWGSIKHY